MNVLKNIINVAAIAFLVYIFTFYVDGEMGAILLSFLVFAPLVSLAFAVYGRKNIKVTFDCDAYVKKGSELEITVNAEKIGKFPLAVVEIVPSVSGVFAGTDKVYRFSMIRAGKKSFKFRVGAEIGGNGEVCIKSAYSCGFLGFVRFKSECKLPPPKSVGVIPEIPDIKASSQLFRSIADIVMTSDEEEDNDTAMLFSANTAPGYEHREYAQGDPLKRINWKLSSKKRRLMVRLDEAAASVQPVIALDLFRSKACEPKVSLKKEEKLLSAVFGLLTLLVKQGIACNFVYRSAAGEVVSESVDNPDYPAQLLLKVLAVKVETEKRIEISQADSAACACIISTTDTGGDFVSSVAGKIENPDNSSIIAVSADCGNPTSMPMWYLDEDNNFKQV